MRDPVTGALNDADTSTTTLPFGYGGYWYHARSGLSLTEFRQYDAKLGRWLSRDPIGVLGGANLYGYVGNNPVNATDASGLAPNWWEAAWIVKDAFWNQFDLLTRPLPRQDDCLAILRELQRTISLRDDQLMQLSLLEADNGAFENFARASVAPYNERISWLRRAWERGPCGGGGSLPADNRASAIDRFAAEQRAKFARRENALVPVDGNFSEDRPRAMDYGNSRHMPGAAAAVELVILTGGLASIVAEFFTGEEATVATAEASSAVGVGIWSGLTSFGESLEWAALRYFAVPL